MACLWGSSLALFSKEFLFSLLLPCSNSVVQVRVQELLLQVAAQRPEWLQALQVAGLLDSLPTFVSSSDPLLQLSIVEVCCSSAVRCDRAP